MTPINKLHEQMEGMSKEEKLKHLDELISKDKKIVYKDPIAEAYRKSNISPKKMMMNSLEQLEVLCIRAEIMKEIT